ncbi:glycosyl transferase, family 9 [Nautilia profundicola AmH]|uniref:Glycosyl transferase, family 9 n=1 Tax=Nautilia profundicola (strain ATCC BAA-1463 / DSM 18972 / AmH) TaxID=598659 RepID=B9L6W0_NAUPA|nr:glycosyltransferase family 9 protein [Nautilia profundicola]ACM92296.1 glycosyl transferase, family 9 [Nautilia profundicola AmH]
MRIFKYIIPYFLPKNQIIKTNLVPMEEIDKIVCFSNTAIGDTLFNTPVFRSLKKHFPDKKLIAVMNPNNYKLFENNPYIDDIILYSGKTKHFFKALKELKEINPKLILALHSNDPQATPLAVLSGAKYIIKLPNDKNQFTKWHSNSIVSKNHNEHFIKTRLKFLKWLGIEETDCRMDLFLKDEWIEEVEKTLPKNKKLIGFQIGASTISRRWFNERWVELGKKLLSKYPDINIVLTGAPNEKELTDEVERGINDKRVLNLAGKFSLGGAAALIDKLDLLVTPDTGPLHMAIALKTPTLGLFVAGEPQQTNACYDLEIHPFIQKPKTCTPCIDKKCKYPECMKQITVDEVLKNVTRQINEV